MRDARSEPTIHPPRGGDPRLHGVRRVARLMDDAFAVPGTRWRIGIDPLLGVVPGAGDALTLIASGWVVYKAWRLGAPPALLARMGANIGIDAVVGAVPLLGDLFDFGWKANTRNLHLLEDWLEPEPLEVGARGAGPG